MQTGQGGDPSSARQDVRLGQNEVRLRALAAGLLGLALAACGGGGGGGGSGPVTDGSPPVTGGAPPVSGIGPTLQRPQSNLERSITYEASAAASGVRNFAGTSTLVQAPTDRSASITFQADRIDISAPSAGQTVSLQNSELVLEQAGVQGKRGPTTTASAA